VKESAFMLFPAEPQRAATALLTSWAIPSAAVASVQPLGSSAAPPELDVLALLGVFVEDAALTPRVMVLRHGHERVAVLARGALKLAEAAANDLLPLPPELLACAPLVSHIAVVNGKAALFVLSAERLLHAARVRTANIPPTYDSASR
jgi:hypothetical protein